MPPPEIHVFQPPPGHPLQPFVLSIFRVRENPHRQETILPKGNVDLLFNLGDAVAAEGLRNGSYLVTPGATWISGLKTRPYVIHTPGTLHLLGVSLRGEACAGIIPLAPAEIVNLEAHDLPPSVGVEMLGEQLRGLSSFADQCALLTRWMTARLRPRRGAEMVRHACALLRRSRAEDAVGETARALAVSPRHLRRMVTEHVGIRPAAYVRLSRFIAATQRLTGPGPTLTQVALDCGYYDQAHFTRDFRSFAGMTPQAYRAQANHPVPGHLVEG